MEIKDWLILAPMAGVSDVGFRSEASFFGADATVSEMLSARAMLNNPTKTAFMTISSPLEKIKIGQIFGHEPEVLAQACQNELLSHYDIIDINMGCPAPKIVRNGEGSALMKNLPLASKIIQSVVKVEKRPVSVKFRLGFNNDKSVDFGRMCEESGAAFVTLHGRTTVQGYSGKADYEAISKLKSAISIPVIGNGDVHDITSYKTMLQTGVDGVMVGRGSMGKPWIFDTLRGGGEPQDKFGVILRHVETLRKYYEEKWLTLYLRKHFLWYVSGMPMASEKRLELATSPSIDESLNILKDIFI